MKEKDLFSDSQRRNIPKIYEMGKRETFPTQSAPFGCLFLYLININYLFEIIFLLNYLFIIIKKDSHTTAKDT